MSQAEVQQINIEAGDRMPEFCLPIHTGGDVRLADYTGKSALVLFYYPKANTPG